MNQLTKEAETKIKEIGQYLFSSSYPKTALTSVFKKFGGDKDTIKALAVLEHGKLIRLDRSLGSSAYLASLVILDDKGKDIRHEMIYDNYGSDLFGNWFYESDEKTFCYDHIKEDNYKPGCEKCSKQLADRICVNHNQSMLLCLECREATKKIKGLISKDESEEFINISIREHKKRILKQRGIN